VTPDAATVVNFAPRDDAEELQRAETYGLLSRLWLRAPDAELLEQFASAVTEAPTAGGYLEAPWQALVAAMRNTTPAAAEREYSALFVGTGKPDVFVYGSFHLAGALNEKPLVALRSELAELGIARDEASGDTEDHVSFVLEVMRYLIAGDDAAVCNLERQRLFFRNQVQPWVASGLCEEVERHPQALVYAAVASFTRAFIEVETQGFDLLQ
jgi:TorA maturation chaperone TorD